MPFVVHRGHRIHYTVEGEGPLVVLQHGMLMDASVWKQGGFIDALTDRYRVACVDSLGHGLSDKPPGTDRYRQKGIRDFLDLAQNAPGARLAAS